MPELQREGRRIHFEDSGAGNPVLALHAFPLSSAMYQPQLAAPTEGFRFIAPDLRGFGNSTGAPGPLTMDAAADDCAALLSHLGLARALVCGTSMGGYVALALAERHPHLVAGLLMVSTQLRADDEAGRAGREKLATDVLARGSAAAAEAMVPRLLSPDAPPSLVAKVDALVRAQSKDAIAAAARGMALRPDRSAVVRALAVPLVAVWGARDAIFPRAKVEELALLALDGTFIALPEAGHLPNLEDPEGFAAALEALARPAANRE